jgi:hypothetical protein
MKRKVGQPKVKHVEIIHWSPLVTSSRNDLLVIEADSAAEAILHHPSVAEGFYLEFI